ncbi:sodium-dependent glucose transporter 1-like [Ornithodoros turicata]|uniref:sodium-dependent glucose transporter 1-like n=1 Tax=Ornithodoros turicata TaxID=34597 RepID=UPI003138BF0F
MDCRSPREMISRTTNKAFLFTLTYTAALCLGCAGLGLVFSLTGVAQLDLAEIYNSNVASVSHLITCRSVGTVLGALIGGRLFDKYNPHLLLILSVAITSFTFALLPLSVNLYLAYLASLVNGLGVGAFGTGAQVRLIRLWPTNPGPAQQTYNFCFGAGCLLAPLLAEPFLSSPASASFGSGNQTWVQPLPVLKEVHRNTSFSHVSESESNIRYGFLVVSAFLAFVFLIMFVLFLIRNHKKEETEELEQKDSRSVQLSPDNVRFSWIVTGLGASYICACVAMESAYGHMLTTFAVMCDLHFAKSSAVYLTEAFYITFTFTRVLAALVALKVSPFGMLLTSKLILLITFTVLSLLGSRSRAVLWIGTMIFGMGLSAVFGGVISFCAKHVVFTNSMMSVLIFMDGLGTISPVVVGQFIVQFPMMLMYTCTATAVVMMVILVIMHVLTKNRGKGNTKVVALERETNSGLGHQLDKRGA